MAKVLKPSSLIKLPKLLSQAFRIVNTNVPWEVVLDLSLSATKFSADKVQTGVLPGNSTKINDAWYWIVDLQKAQPVIDTLVWGEPEPLKLVVLNGNGRAGIAGKVADDLTAYGYHVASRGVMRSTLIMLRLRFSFPREMQKGRTFGGLSQGCH